MVLHLMLREWDEDPVTSLLLRHAMGELTYDEYRDRTIEMAWSYKLDERVRPLLKLSMHFNEEPTILREILDDMEWDLPRANVTSTQEWFATLKKK